MKDARFIELVNLYIDRQISSDETTELEAELQSNPRRRQIYQQYCHMHRATKLVYESFRTHADQGAAASTGSSTIARFESRKRAAQRSRWMYSIGGLAAAACVAIALVRSGGFPKSDPAPLAPNQPAAVQAAITVQPTVPAQPSPAAAVARAEVSMAEKDYAAMIASIRQDDRSAFAVKPLFDDGVFDSKQADTRRVFPNKPRPDGRAAEFTAFQFQR